MVKRFVFLTAVLALASGLGIYAWHAHGRPQPPVVDLEGADPAVAKVVKDAAAAVRQSPGSVSAWGRLGMLLYAHAYRPEAQVCFAEAEKLDPQEPRWPYYQGLLLMPADRETAAHTFRRALELWGNESEIARLRLADTLLAMGSGEEASEQYRLLLQVQPSHAGAHLGLARVAYELGDWQESLLQLSQCAENYLTRHAAHTLMAAVYQRLGDSDRAREQLQIAARLTADAEWPDPFVEEAGQLLVDRKSRLRRAEALLNARRVQQGMAELVAVLKDYPDWDLGWQRLGFAYLQQSNYASAEQALSRALQLAPASAETYFYLGIISRTRGSMPEAVAHFRHATQLRPDYVLAHEQLAQCLEERGDRAGALAALRAAVRIRPYFAAAHRQLGELLAKEGNTKGAETHLRQAVELDPADKQAKLLLGRIDATLPPARPH